MKSSTRTGHSFSVAPTASIQRSKFKRDNGYKTTFDTDWLVPFFVDEALPGDTHNLRASLFARLNTPLKPILDNMFAETFFFEVPVRQVWDNWQKFNGEQDNPTDSTDYLVPTCTAPVGGYLEESLQDYMGIPPGIAGIEHSALFTRAYNLIWNEWFRDQNIQQSVVVNKGDGPDSPTDYKLLKRGKRHDYFTSSLPWPQKSDQYPDGVPIAIGGSAPVRGIGADPSLYPVVDKTVGESNGLTDLYATASVMDNDTLPGNSLFYVRENPNAPGYPGIYADLSDATAATVNSLRQSIAIQHLLERDARGGTRYIEVVYAHFGVRSPDLRLQRPGYLGGGRSTVNISPVAQTSQSFSTASTDTPQANLAAIGTLSGTGHGFTKSFTEHTIIIGLINVRADLTYQQALNRMWSRQTRWDFYWPEFANLGEMAVLQKEIYASGVPAEDNTVFGYQEAFADYRYKPSLITGKMRSSSPTSLDVWHLSQDFLSAPTLSDGFITENVPLDRCIATPDEPHFKLDAFINLTSVRPMPMYGIPGLAKL
ncbi:major capsid protein [Microviridae sp.]|nr:major capsid protein [Microviridae sp.]